MGEMDKFQSSSDSSYASIPSSPRSKFSNSFNSNTTHLYSEPTSPTRTSSASDFPFLWEIEKEQLTKSSPSGDNSDEDFEFKTTTTNFDTPLKFLQHQPGLLNHNTEQAISFADQLFHNGQIFPLKPPPRYQYRDGSNIKSASEKSVQKSSFTCWSFNKSDFDPFIAALEHVKKEERRRHYQGSPPKSRRRSRSLSPMRSTSPSRWTNSNDHSSSWNIKTRSNQRHQNSTPPTQPTDQPKISAFKKPIERPSNKPTTTVTTLVVFPGRSVQVVSVQKKYKRGNIVKDLVLRMECLGGKGRL